MSSMGSQDVSDPTSCLCIIMIFSIIFRCIYLCSWIACISLIHSHLLVPFCALPGMMVTGFCMALRAANTTPPDLHLPGLCGLPVLSSLPFCHPPNANHLSSALEEEFKRLKSLLQTSDGTPMLIHDIGNAVHALDDLIVLVRNSDIRHRAAVEETLNAISAAGQQSSEALQAYAARVSSAVRMCVTVFNMPHPRFNLTGDLIQYDCFFILHHQPSRGQRLFQRENFPSYVPPDEYVPSLCGYRRGVVPPLPPDH